MQDDQAKTLAKRILIRKCDKTLRRNTQRLDAAQHAQSLRNEAVKSHCVKKQLETATSSITHRTGFGTKNPNASASTMLS